MADNQVIIKIGANSKGVDSELDKIGKKTEALEKRLKTAAQASGIAFAALTGAIGLTVSAYAEAQKSNEQLSQAMRKQGIFSEDLLAKYDALAKALQLKSNFDDDAIKSATGVLQSFVGQREVTEGLVQATLDLAQAQGMDLASAAELVGKSVGTSTNALARQGVEISASLRGQARLDAVVAGVNARFGGQAEAAMRADSGMRQLSMAVGDLMEAIGAHLAPIVKAAAGALTQLAVFAERHPTVTKMAAAFLLVGSAVAGLGLVASTAGIGLLKMVGILRGVTTAVAALGLGVKGLIGATGIGLLVIAVSDLALNWDTRLNQMRAGFEAFVKAIQPLMTGFGNLLTGVFTAFTEGGRAKLRQGLAEIKAAFVQMGEDFREERRKQNEQEIVDEKTQREKKRELAGQETELDNLELETDRIARVERERAFGEEMNKIGQETRDSDRIASMQFTADRLKRERDEKVLRSTEEQKYGKNVAAIKAFWRKDEVTTTQSFFQDMAGLMQTNNKSLFRIGQAFAIANAIMNTAQGVTRTLAQYPWPFSIVAAAAQGAIGAAQIATIAGQKFAAGGLVEGGTRGVDSVPAFLQPGELVTPRRNFEEVVQSVAASRAGAQAGGRAMPDELAVRFYPDYFMQFIEVNLLRRQEEGTSQIPANLREAA